MDFGETEDINAMYLNVCKFGPAREERTLYQSQFGFFDKQTQPKLSTKVYCLDLITDDYTAFAMAVFGMEIISN